MTIPDAHHCRPRRPPRGATIIELSFVLFTLMVLGFGVVEAGHFYFIRQQVQGAAREGARAAIPAGASNSDVTAAVNAVLTSSGLTPASFTTTVKVNGVVANASSSTAGQRIEVSVQAQWGTVGLRPMSLIRSDAVVRGVASMRREGN
jgi:Flp pilus assembly protein TadG